MAHMLVEANDVCLTYHEPTAETRAIEHLSFQINQGEFVAIVGPVRLWKDKRSFPSRRINGALGGRNSYI